MDIDSSPYSSPTIYPLSSALEGLDEGALPRLTLTNTNTNPTSNQTNSQDLEGPSSDPLAMGENTPFPGTRATTQRQEQSRKRGPSSPIQTIRLGKEPSSLSSRLAPNAAFAPPLDLNNLFGPTKLPGVAQIQAKEALLQARDLILKASLLVKDRDEQSRILDLLGIFREYIEKGTVLKTTAIIASQVANLERATRKVEILAKPRNSAVPSQTPTQPTQPIQLAQPTQLTQLSYAQIAKSPSSNTSWTLVNAKEQAKAKLANSQKNKEQAKSKEKNRRLILINSAISGSMPFSPFKLRNAINDAFKKAGQVELVVRSVSKTLADNIVVSTTESFSAQFLLDHKLVWEHIIPHKGAKRDQNYYKVAIYSIPLGDFNSENGLSLIKDKITTFNKGLDPIGVYWLTSQERRQDNSTRVGSIAVAFATQQEATRAIRQRLYIAGSSVKVVEFRATPPLTQCSKCQGFGHPEARCQNTLACGLCASNSHATFQHKCTECTTKGNSCKHLVPKCANCKEPHIASSLSCEIRQSLFRRTL
jgi:hypothetical protein